MAGEAKPAAGSERDALVVDQPGWDTPAYCDMIDRLVAATARRSSRALVANVTTTLGRLDVDGLCVPVAVNDAEYDNSTINSEYAGLTVSAQQELAHAPAGWRRAQARLLLTFATPILRLFSIDRIVRFYPGVLNLETPPNVSEAFVKAATAAAVAAYPGHTVKWTMLNPTLDAGTLEALRAAGYLIRIARPSYILRAGSRPNKNLPHSANKYRRRSGHVLELLETGDDGIYARIAQLYALINLRPGRTDNPAITATGFRELHRAGAIRLCVARESATGAINACCMYVARNGVMSPRFIAYDPDDPLGHEHYVGIASTLNLEALRNGWAVRLGYGGARAKRNRGAEEQIDYSAYYVDHLPWARRLVWRMLNAIVNRQGEPIIRAMLAADRARSRPDVRTPPDA